MKYNEMEPGEFHDEHRVMWRFLIVAFFVSVSVLFIIAASVYSDPI